MAPCHNPLVPPARWLGTAKRGALPRSDQGALPRSDQAGAVVNAVKIDRLAVVVDPCTVGWRGEADHRRQRRPEVDMRHHFA
jgi:hypothetical protein